MTLHFRLSPSLIALFVSALAASAARQAGLAPESRFEVVGEWLGGAHPALDGN